MGRMVISKYKREPGATSSLLAPGGIEELLKANYITEEWKQQGLSLREEGDHILELLKDGKVIARFSQTGVKVDNILKEVEAGKYGN